MEFPIFDILKKSFIAILFATVVISIQNPAYAQSADCVGYDPNDVASLAQIVCPAARLVNILLYFAGAVFVAMIFVGSIKYAMSLGDPKGAIGANQTLTYAVIGLIAVLGVFSILNIIAHLLGLTNIESLNVFKTIQTRICDFLISNGVVEDGAKIAGC